MNNDVVLIADNDLRRRDEIEGLLSEGGFLVLAVSSGLDCLDVLAVVQTEVLVIAVDIPWGGGDGVIARLNDGLRLVRKPITLVLGDATAETLALRTGVRACNCFPHPVRTDDLLDRITREVAIARLAREKNGSG